MATADPHPAGTGARPAPIRLPEEAAAAALLRSPPPPGYLEAWAERIGERPAAVAAGDVLAFGLFRLGGETFALETRHVVEVRPLARVRPVPGRTHEVFRGLVSLRGVIHLVGNLHALLGLKAPTPPPATARLLVVERPGQRWALEVDEVVGFDRAPVETVRAAQVTIAKSAVHFTDGMITTPRGTAARMDAERLFDGLGRSLE